MKWNNQEFIIRYLPYLHYIELIVKYLLSWLMDFNAFHTNCLEILYIQSLKLLELQISWIVMERGTSQMVMIPS